MKKLQQLQLKLERLQALEGMFNKLEQAHENGDKESNLEEVLEELKKYRNELEENTLS